MVKLTLEIKEKDKDLKVNLLNPTDKQLETASENEKFIAQAFKDLFDEKLLWLLQEKFDNR